MNRDELLKEVLLLVERHKSLHLNDPAIYQIWLGYAELLSEDMDNTKWVLLNVGAPNLYRISEAFEDISVKLRSREFIVFLKELDAQYPEAEMKTDIELAEKVIEP